MVSRNRGRQKPKLRDLTRSKPTNEEAEQLLNELASPQKPIVTAILGQALVETELDELLRGHFARRDDDTWADLTDHNGPLATFYNKIVAAYAFGVCDDVIRDSLNTVRHIRNAFAHSKKKLEFSHELIVKELKSVPLPTKGRKKLHKDLSEARTLASQSKPNPQLAYVVLCMTLANELLRKQNARLTAKNRRLRKKYQKDLATALIGNQPSMPQHGLLSFLSNQTDGSGLLAPEQSRRKSVRSDTKTGRNKDKQ